MSYYYYDDVDDAILNEAKDYDSMRSQMGPSASSGDLKNEEVGLKLEYLNW